ncbi:MAG TPA: pyridoxamine 5'-phosphate oxidase family protein [Streptosporangiaceae bacterium]|nr:pyridoxamine 5'-phosphate oxidase family protein [Streptosporangiaceae bacterium]
MSTDADSAGTDLGRRLAEQRSRAGLSLTDVAERAGMSPGYLAYLESSSYPNPSHATLTRLAAALDTVPESLTGAGMNVPPGQRSAAKNPVLNSLSHDECMQLVARGGIGRFLYDEPGRGPVAVPVNFRMAGDDVVFRTTSEGSVTEGLHGQAISFDVDHFDDALGEGWSVLLSGTASVITDPAELDQAKALGIEPWAGGDRHTYVRIAVTEVTGRRIRVTS